MSFDAFAVTTAWGPHVTLQAGVVHLGRHWTTTSRRSAKARAARRTRRAAVTTLGPDGTLRILAGPVRVLDGARPMSLLADPLSVGLAPAALGRLSFGQLPQVLGYAEAGAAVPVSWLPFGRVVLVTEITDELVALGGAPVSGRGRWARAATAARPFGDPTDGGARRSPPPSDLPEPVPAQVRALARSHRPCWVGLATPAGVVALPGRWNAEHGSAEVPAALLAALEVDLAGGGCVTLDESSDRRPDRKFGCMLRGDVRCRLPPDGAGGCAELQVDARRVTWWLGFRSGTEHVFDRPR